MVRYTRAVLLFMFLFLITTLPAASVRTAAAQGSSLPVWLFKGAYADYGFEESGAFGYPRYQYTITDVNIQAARFSVTLQTLYPNQNYPNATFPGGDYNYVLPVVDPSNLAQLNQGTIPSGPYELPYASVTASVGVEVPAGGFTADKVTFTRNIELGPGSATSPDTAAYYDSTSGLLVESTGMVNPFFTSGGTAYSVTLQLEDTNIPMSSSDVVTSRTPPPILTASSGTSFSQTYTGVDTISYSNPNIGGGLARLNVTIPAGASSYTTQISSYGSPSQNCQEAFQLPPTDTIEGCFELASSTTLTPGAPIKIDISWLNPVGAPSCPQSAQVTVESIMKSPYSIGYVLVKYGGFSPQTVVQGLNTLCAIIIGLPTLGTDPSFAVFSSAPPASLTTSSSGSSSTTSTPQPNGAIPEFPYQLVAVVVVVLLVAASYAALRARMPPSTSRPRDSRGKPLDRMGKCQNHRY